MKVKIIYNPVAGNGKARQALNTIKKMLYKTKLEFVIYETKKERDAVNAARTAEKEEFDAVVAAGGDGTVCEVAEGLMDVPLAMGILPLGNVNAFSSGIGINKNYLRVLETLSSTSKIKQVDVGKAIFTRATSSKAVSKESSPEKEEKYFLLGAGTVLASFFTKTAGKASDNFGDRMKSYFEGVKEIFSCKFSTLEVSLEREEGQTCVDAAMVAINNVRGGTRFIPPEECDPADGFFDVFIFKSSAKIDLLRYYYAVVRGQALPSGSVEIFKTSHLKVKVKKTVPELVPVFIDGSLVGELPIEFECIPQSLSVIL